MLPFFKIIDNSRMHHQDVPAKPKRNKRVDVQVHGTHKNFSANFSGKQRDNRTSGRDEVTVSEEVTGKISRRVLRGENERLLNENQELINAQDHLNKKNCKLKEKLIQSHLGNEELINENNSIKIQYEELVNVYNQCRNELEKPRICQNCIELNNMLDRTKRDYSAIRKANQELHEDCNMLKTVVYRLNVQLERYQQKLHVNKIPLKEKSERKDYENTSTVPAENLCLGDTHYTHVHTPISWGKVNSHTLGPLLEAYQESVNEKDEIIEGYEAELTRFTGQLKEIIKENESLYTKLTEDDECSKVLSTQIENLKTELKTTKDSNDLLVKMCALKQDKIEEILKCYEQKVDQLKRDYTVLHEQYCKSKTEVVSLTEKNKSLANARDDFKSERQQYIPISVHNSSVNECKKWYEELKHQYENEKSKLMETIERLREQMDELNKRICVYGAERNELEGKLKTAEKIIKRAETKYLELEHNLHEVQLSRSACRKQLHKAMSFAKDLVSEQESLLKALNQRQQENKAVKKIGTNIASRMDLLRNELKCVQKEAWQELSTVEERIQEQDSMITCMKQEHEHEVERLKQIIKEKENNILLREDTSIPNSNYVLYKHRNVHS